MTYNRRETTLAKSSGLAHKDIYPIDDECAKRLGLNRSTPYRWGKGAPSSPTNRHSQYFLEADRPWESLAHFESIAKWKVIVKLTDAELIERYWELVEAEKNIECTDNIEGHQPGHAWLDRARTKRRDAAIELELSAVMTEFEARGMTKERVWAEGGTP